MNNWTWREFAVSLIIVLIVTLGGKYATERFLDLMRNAWGNPMHIIAMMEVAAFLLVAGATVGAEIYQNLMAARQGQDFHVHFRAFVPTFVAVGASGLMVLLLMWVKRILGV